MPSQLLASIAVVEVELVIYIRKIKTIFGGIIYHHCIIYSLYHTFNKIFLAVRHCSYTLSLVSCGNRGSPCRLVRCSIWTNRNLANRWSQIDLILLLKKVERKIKTKIKAVRATPDFEILIDISWYLLQKYGVGCKQIMTTKLFWYEKTISPGNWSSKIIRYCYSDSSLTG